MAEVPVSWGLKMIKTQLSVIVNGLLILHIKFVTRS